MACALVLVVPAGCGSRPASPAPQPAPPSTVATGQPPLPAVRGSVGAVPLVLEVASTDVEREAGLRGRVVPAGTGMAFPYPGGRVVRFTMAGVDRPLVAVFARAGRALSVERLVPCAGTVDQCPTYGPPEPVDVVVETAPGTLPVARPGDPVVVGATPWTASRWSSRTRPGVPRW